MTPAALTMVLSLIYAGGTTTALGFSLLTSNVGRCHRTLRHVSFAGARATNLHLTTGPAALDEMSEEHKARLFETLLRDLQIEGVPLLGCDAGAVHTLSAALWTTMAELSESDEEGKVCLVMEKIPVRALTAFVEDFIILKTQQRLIRFLPELARISVSIIGNGIGPAFIIEAAARTESEITEKNQRNMAASGLNEMKVIGALRSFVERVVVGIEACPYTKSADISAYGLEARGVPPAPVAYRYCGSSDACSALGSFWNCVCELLATDQSQLSTTVLSLPGIGPNTTREDHDRMAAVLELVSRNLCLYRGDSVFGLVHFHPAYDRDLIQPVDKPAYGHLPPRTWLRSMLRMNGNIEAAESLTNEQLALSDYQRRAPHTAINILRVNQINAATGAKSIVDLDIGDGLTEKASGVPLYSRNAIRLASVGKEMLQAAVDAERAMAL